jgi:hypothetical protein
VRKHVRLCAAPPVTLHDVMVSTLNGKLLKFCGLLEHGAMAKVSQTSKALLETTTGLENLDFNTIQASARFGAMAFVCRHLKSYPDIGPVYRLKATLGTHETLPMAALLHYCGSTLVRLDYCTTNMHYVPTQYPPFVGPSLNLADDDEDEDEEVISHASYLENMFQAAVQPLTLNQFYGSTAFYALGEEEVYGKEINIPQLCPNLHELHGVRQHCAIGPTKISELKSLTHLELNLVGSNDLDAIASQISKLKTLTYLRLHGSWCPGVLGIKSLSLRVLGCEEIPKSPSIYIHPSCTNLRVITLFDKTRGNGLSFETHPVTYGGGWSNMPEFLLESAVQIPSECVVLFSESIYLAGERYTLSDGMTRHPGQSCPPWFQNYADSFDLTKLCVGSHHTTRWNCVFGT